MLIGKPLVLPLKLRGSLLERSGMTTQPEHNTPKVQQGRAAESLLRELVRDLLTVDDVSLAPRHSVADDYTKVDLLIEVGSNLICLQVKASEVGARQHFTKNTTVQLGGKTYPAPACVVVGVKPNRLALAKVLVSELAPYGVRFKDSVQVAITTYNDLRKVLASKVLTTKLATTVFPGGQLNHLVQLGLVRRVQDTYVLR